MIGSEMFKYLISLILFLISTTAIADQRIIGHMLPLPEEMLNTPVTLDCGVVIKEVRGGSLNIAKLNRMCSLAESRFFPFVESKGLTPRNHSVFSWGVSFLPEPRCYRCLNDEDYRFKYRHVHGALIGYTDLEQRYIFMLSDFSDREFNVTFVHELFHAMSMYYGIYESHVGSWGEKTAADDKLAYEFTETLGYGR
jgi:hypothetical protein